MHKLGKTKEEEITEGLDTDFPENDLDVKLRKEQKEIHKLEQDILKMIDLDKGAIPKEVPVLKCVNCDVGLLNEAKFCHLCGNSTKTKSVVTRKVGDVYDGFTKDDLAKELLALDQEEKEKEAKFLIYRKETIYNFFQTATTIDIVASSNPFNIPVLQVLNYWDRNQYQHYLKDIFTKGEIDLLHRIRTSNGGVFWNLDELCKAIKLLRKRPDMVLAAIFPTIQMEHSLLAVLTPQITLNCQAKSFQDGRSCLATVLKMIKTATRYIHLSVTWFFNDKFGQLIGRALIEKAKQGVAVRILVDEINKSEKYNGGRLGTFMQLKDILVAAGVCVVFVNLPRLREAATWNAFRTRLLQQGVPHLFIMMRDLMVDTLSEEDAGKKIPSLFHQKFMVADDLVSWVGSLNIGEEYLNDEAQSSPSTWLDGLLLVENEHFAIRLNFFFAFLWTVWGGAHFSYNDPTKLIQPRLDPGKIRCATFFSFPGNPTNVNRDYINSLLVEADGDLYIHSPYLLEYEFWETLGDTKKVDPLSEVGATPDNRVVITTCFTVNDKSLPLHQVKEVVKNPNVEIYDYSASGRFSHWNVLLDTNVDCAYMGSCYFTERQDYDLAVVVSGSDFTTSLLSVLQLHNKAECRVTTENCNTKVTKDYLLPFY
eukprot:TRINITY_DN5283_c0_g1_i16.p1 TRINITY_DN5283_c0_g1~~TRINITY_DN5283_c0_g1_i16.p1  ORF type:complete len:650 (-),score=140.90 TRINITY_DN5283_c0_g1_i16:174-2123(-)